MKKKHNLIKLLFVIFQIIILFGITGCCSKYNYYMYMDNVEKALKNKNYKKAKNLTSYAYKQENLNQSNDNFDKKAWIFYRLGVIAELQGDLLSAKGYYWGDSFDEGYYSKEPKIAWLARTGWLNIDNGKKARSLEEILELETKDPPKKAPPKEKKVVKRKKKKKAAYVPKQRVYNVPEGMYAPDPNDESMFQVYH